MLLSFHEAIETYGNQYNLAKAVDNRNLYRIEAGIYSTSEFVPTLAVIMRKHPKAVLSGLSAFYCHSLTDVIPEKYDLATGGKSARLLDTRIHQEYVRNDLFSMGITEMDVEGYPIRIYDKERMLIELLRRKNSMPYDLYKEILLHYREMINDLELWRIQEYASVFPKSKMISKALDEEVL